MPEISRFLGIVIAMFYREHGPPHFHAVSGEFEITVEIQTSIVSGRFPPRALAHVISWAEMHRAELLEDWFLARQGRALRRIAPLE